MLPAHHPKVNSQTREEKNGERHRPALCAFAQLNKITAQFENARLPTLSARKRMVQMCVRLEPISIGCLQSAQFLGFISARVGWETFVEEQVPDLLSHLGRVECFVLRVTHPAKFLGRLGRFRAITAAHELDYSLAPGELLPQDTTQIDFVSFENILPDWIVAQEYQSVGYQLPRASQLPANGRNKDERPGIHRRNRLPKPPLRHKFGFIIPLSHNPPEQPRARRTEKRSLQLIATFC